MTSIRMIRLAAGLVATFILLTLGAGGADAHTQIEGSEPADGAVLQQAPDRVTITFSEPPLPTGLAVVAQGPVGRLALPAQVRGNSVVAAWPAGEPGGDYVVTYRVVADDGHPITGELAFRIKSSRTPPAPTTAAPRPTSTATPTADPAGASAAPPAAGPMIPWGLWLLGAALVVAGSYVLISRNRAMRDHGEEGGSGG